MDSKCIFLVNFNNFGQIFLFLIRGKIMTREEFKEVVTFTVVLLVIVFGVLILV